jgi:hypothetical protein
MSKDFCILHHDRGFNDVAVFIMLLLLDSLYSGHLKILGFFHISPIKISVFPQAKVKFETEQSLNVFLVQICEVCEMQRNLTYK